MKRGLEFIVHTILAVACLSLMVFATWDRPETTAIGGCLLGLSFVLIALIGYFRKWAGANTLDAVVLVFLAYMFWRVRSSEVAVFVQMDTFLLLLVAGVWLLRSYFRAHLECWKKLWVWLMLTMLVANSAASVYQLQVEPTWGLFIQRSEIASRYVSGVFSHYNYLANFCMLSLVSVLGAVFSRKMTNPTRVIAGIVAIGNITLLAMAHSRGAFIASLVAVILFLIISMIVSQISESSSKGRKASLMGAFVVILGAVLWLSYLGESRGWVSSGNEVIDNGRIEMTSLAVDQFLHEPMFGYGARSFEWAGVELWPSELSLGIKTLDYVHNEYLQLLAEYGGVGLGLFVCCAVGLILEFIYSLFLKKASFGECVFVVAALSGVIGFGVQSLFSFTAHIPALLLTVLFVAVLGRRIQGRAHLWLVYTQNTLLLVCGGIMLSLSIKEVPAFLLYTKSNETYSVDYKGQEAKLDEDIVALSEVVAVAPNNQRYERLGLLAGQAYQAATDKEKKANYLQLSVDAFEQAVKLYPKSPMHRVNYARVLVWAERGDEAQPHFEYAITHAPQREYWTNAHWYYAKYYFERGSELWFSRRTEEAYFCYLKSEKLLEKAKRNRFSKEMPQLLKKRLKLFSDTNVEPKKPEGFEEL